MRLQGFSVGSASLACFLLFSAFLDEVSELAGHKVEAVDISVPEVFLGGVAGATLVFYFSGQCMTAVGSAAQEVVNNVRQQFRERPGIMDGSQKPDYASCVSIVTQAALHEMVAPGLVATTVPLMVGFFFRLTSSAQAKLKAKLKARQPRQVDRRQGHRELPDVCHVQRRALRHLPDRISFLAFNRGLQRCLKGCLARN